MGLAALNLLIPSLSFLIEKGLRENLRRLSVVSSLKICITRKNISAQKMEAIGTLDGGVGHDFNNILFPIIGYTEMPIDEAAKNSTTHDWLKVILNSSIRARDLVQ